MNVVRAVELHIWTHAWIYVPVALLLVYIANKLDKKIDLTFSRGPRTLALICGGAGGILLFVYVLLAIRVWGS